MVKIELIMSQSGPPMRAPHRMQYIPTLPTHSCGVPYSHFDKDTKPVKHLYNFGRHMQSMSYHIGTAPISKSLNCLNTSPFNGLVRKSAIILSVGHHTTNRSPFAIRSAT